MAWGGNCGGMMGLDKSQQWWGHDFCMDGWQQNANWENLDNSPILHDAGEANWPESMAEIKAQNKDTMNMPWESPAPGMAASGTTTTIR